MAAAMRIGLAIVIVPPPGRHHDIIRELAKAGHPTPVRGKQGFLTSFGQFANRKRAWLIAERAGQLLEGAPTDGRGGVLYSEDLW